MKKQALVEWNYWALVNNGEATLCRANDCSYYNVFSVYGRPMTLVASFFAPHDLDAAKRELDRLLPSRHSVARWYR